jgi:hypothetical protein
MGFGRNDVNLEQCLCDADLLSLSTIEHVKVYFNTLKLDGLRRVSKPASGG